MTTQMINDRLRAFFLSSFENRELGEDEDIFSQGFGNSLFAMQLVEFLEVEFNLEIDNDDLDLDNFRTMDRISTLVSRKIQAMAAA
ncbi:MAG: phosphopantetheine-binding protein [Candidatus Binatia bacterium]|nr:phosphopantetheine-binding protein [Candidatus Binatia bacterium]